VWQGEGGALQSNDHVHVTDGERRVALLRAGAAHPDDPGPATQFHLPDGIDSSHLVLDGDGRLINREEYTPYGETSFGCFSRKRYRFTGKERDEESSLSYHGARYYVPWLGRWTAVDPDCDTFLPLSPFSYAFGNPLRFTDPTGGQPEPKGPSPKTEPKRAPRQQWLFEARVFWQKVTATARTPGYGKKLRMVFQNFARLWGHSGEVDVGHEKGKPFWSLRAGESSYTFIEPTDANRREGREEAEAKARHEGFKRQGRVDPTAPKDVRYTKKMQLNPWLSNPNANKRIVFPEAMPSAPAPETAPAPRPPSEAGAARQLELPLGTRSAEPGAGRVARGGGFIADAGSIAGDLLRKADWEDLSLGEAFHKGPAVFALTILDQAYKGAQLTAELGVRGIRTGVRAAARGIRAAAESMRERFTSEDYTWKPWQWEWVHDLVD
jgi:RHS repeat-associated protein